MLNNSILLFSYNPVPTSEYRTVEGSALRFWRMALSLKEKGYDVTIAIWQKFPQASFTSAGINITSFCDNPVRLKELTKDFDAIVVSCAMGPLSEAIFNSISSSTRVIIDAYSPMYVEFLTQSLDKRGDEEWLSQYAAFAHVFNKLLIRADHILIANKPQLHFYRGVLAGLQALPAHDDSRFIFLPAYVERDNRARQKKLSTRGKVRLLWFGGVYPWFDISSLIHAFNDEKIKKRAQLRIVGGSNPFYPKDNMRFNGKYIKAKELSDNLGLTGTTIFFDDWAEYNSRIDVFNAADLAISINNEFLENDYSFRLRVADLAGNGVPIVTNGGDPLGEYLIQERAAFKISLSSHKQLAKELLSIIKDPTSISNAKNMLAGPLYDELHIYKHINELIRALEDPTAPGQSRGLSSPYFNAMESTNKNAALTKLYMTDVQQVSTVNLITITIKRLKSSLAHKARTLFKKVLRRV